jgi:hypothetical protein
MDIKDKAREQLNGLERILHKVPGFKGYLERELRRDSDRRQREFVVKQLRLVKSGMNQVIQTASRAKDFDLLREYDLFARKLDASIGVIRYADQGYTGFFDLLKIREPELDRVYEQDAQIVEAAGSFAEEFKKLAAAPLESSWLSPLRDGLERIDGMVEQRTAQLKGFAKGESA